MGTASGLFHISKPRRTLVLKKGIRVMHLVKHGLLVNGSLGEIVDWVPQSNTSPYPVHPIFRSEHDGRHIVITPLLCCDEDNEDDVFACLPLIPAEALSIHKSMGATLPSVIVDCAIPAAGGGRRRGMFAPNQLLVAVSRVRSTDVLAVKHYQRGQDVKFCKDSHKWMNRLEAHSRTQAAAVNSFLASLGCLGNAPTSGSGVPTPFSAASSTSSAVHAGRNEHRMGDHERDEPELHSNEEPTLSDEIGGAKTGRDPLHTSVAVTFTLNHEDGRHDWTTSITPISSTMLHGSGRRGSGEHPQHYDGCHHTLHDCITKFEAALALLKRGPKSGDRMLYYLDGRCIAHSEQQHKARMCGEHIEILPQFLVEDTETIHIDVFRGKAVKRAEAVAETALIVHKYPNLLDCLNPGKFLHDEVVNSYLQVLRWELMSREVRDVLVFDSFFFTKLRWDGVKGVLRWTRSKHLQKLSGCQEGSTVFDHRLILVPVHLEYEQHWTWICVDMLNTNVTYFDSLRNDDDWVIQAEKQAKAQDICEMQVRWLRAEHVDKGLCGELPSWRTESRPTDMPQQFNGYDCGMFMLMTMSRKALSIPFADVEQQTMSSNRRLLRSILELGQGALANSQNASFAFGQGAAPAMGAAAGGTTSSNRPPRQPAAAEPAAVEPAAPAEPAAAEPKPDATAAESAAAKPKPAAAFVPAEPEPPAAVDASDEHESSAAEPESSAAEPVAAAAVTTASKTPAAPPSQHSFPSILKTKSQYAQEAFAVMGSAAGGGCIPRATRSVVNRAPEDGPTPSQLHHQPTQPGAGSSSTRDPKTRKVALTSPPSVAKYEKGDPRRHQDKHFSEVAQLEEFKPSTAEVHARRSHEASLYSFPTAEEAAKRNASVLNVRIKERDKEKLKNAPRSTRAAAKMNASVLNARIEENENEAAAKEAAAKEAAAKDNGDSCAPRTLSIRPLCSLLAAGLAPFAPRLSPSARRWGCPAPQKGLLPPVHRVAAADS